VDHAIASKDCIARMGVAYKATNKEPAAGKAAPKKQPASGESGLRACLLSVLLLLAGSA